eukprot:comp4185_c0_seq1/m.2600 comp4185_c0_seq1/g.2600  ORF comp4185_c0_seq1/g.2600 comp4185_c0_seq1/m.2600 type:complete len:165 (-) comp4185_c0_seq1:22-516(-)
MTAMIAQLGLQRHPEGGWFKEMYRSASTVAMNGAPRAYVTSIYFLLEPNQFSRWHAIDADEVWLFSEGDPLELVIASPDFSHVESTVLDHVSRGGSALKAVPAHWWQAARPLGATHQQQQQQAGFSLVSCTVGPGFDFAGFQFMQDPQLQEKVRADHPSYAALI